MTLFFPRLDSGTKSHNAGWVEPSPPPSKHVSIKPGVSHTSQDMMKCRDRRDRSRKLMKPVDQLAVGPSKCLVGTSTGRFDFCPPKQARGVSTRLEKGVDHFDEGRQRFKVSADMTAVAQLTKHLRRHFFWLVGEAKQNGLCVARSDSEELGKIKQVPWGVHPKRLDHRPQCAPMGSEHCSVHSHNESVDLSR